jgi:hypothetical protein
MGRKLLYSAQWVLPVTVGVCLLALVAFVRPAGAINPLPIPEPIPGSYGLAATKTQEAPTQAPTITTPGNGSSFNTSPITVSGICPNDLLVQVYNNGVLAGSVMCTNGSFSLQVSLFAGLNELSAIGYDSLEQAGPTSNTVTVNYTDTSFSAFGQLITLTSQYGRRSAPVNNELTWPLQLTGGNGPYAFSIDWGDGGESQLMSSPVAGAITIAHTYKNAGIYQVNIRVTDVNGVSAFLQVIAVASGKVEEGAATTGDIQPTVTTNVLWWPAAICIALLIPTFWLGRRSQLVSLHNKMLKERDAFQDK